MSSQLHSPQEPLTLEKAKELFVRLVRQHGLQWTARVPAEHYELLAQCNKVLTTKDRRDALGLP